MINDKDLVKLNNVDHASQRVVAEFGAQWGDNQMTCLVHTAEMRTLQGTYPILFQSTADAEYPLPVALMGFETGENLFLSGAGWREPVIPMMMRKGPFYIASEASQSGTLPVRYRHGPVSSKSKNQYRGAPLLGAWRAQPLS